jgi:hypothetical protein
MKRVVTYLIVMLLVYCSTGWFLIFNPLTISNKTVEFVIYCGLCGGIGGVTYCLRGVYLNACVHNKWSTVWLPWYFIRPIVSFICGAISYLFLKTGLIVFEAQQPDSSSNFAFYALAFIAGLNVDRFMEKIEDIAQATWGIKKSRVSTKDDSNS